MIQTQGYFITFYIIHVYIVYARGPIFEICASYICCNISLRLNHYNLRAVKVIDFLFSTLHTTPLLFCTVYFRVLNLLRASIATYDTPPGSKPP